MTITANRLGIDTDAPGAYNTKHNNREKKLAETIREDKNIELTFQSSPIVSSTDASGAPLPAEAAACTVAINIDGQPAEYRLSVVESTGTALYSFPSVASTGLAIPLDANQVDGVTASELTFGTTARSKAAFVIGTDGPFFVEATISIADISDLEEMWLGFRKAEAYQADPDSYADVAAWHIGENGATLADGSMNLATILNDASTAYTLTTNTAWADAASKTLRVTVSKAGVVTWSINGAAPTVTTSFTFDSGDTVIPFLYCDNTVGSTAGDPGVVVSSLKCGKL